MNEVTRAAMAAAIAAQQAKIGKIKPLSNVAAKPAPVKPAPVVPAKPAPVVPAPVKPAPVVPAKMINVDQLINAILAPEPAQQPAPVQQPAPAPAPVALPAAKVQIVENYSAKAFAVTGSAEQLLNLRSVEAIAKYGSYNKYLKCGAGYIFSNKRLPEVKQALKYIAL